MVNRDDPLLQPFRLKGLVLRNRIMSTAHAIGYEEDGKPKRRYQLYHEEKAKGGIALTMFGGSANVAPDSPAIFGQLYVGDDSIIPYFQEFASRIHAHGCALMCQLTHMGRRTRWDTGHWLPVIAPSRVREPLHRGIPKEMDHADIQRVVRAFGSAARRCQEGGLDGCEILAHGHLIDQFWSPATNTRSDEFGGSISNRTRFSRMVLEEVRSRVGDSFIVGMRMPMSEAFQGGLSKDDCLEIAKIHEDTGLLDFVNVNHGHIDTAAGLSAYMPGMGSRLAPFLELAGEFKRTLHLPIFHACRISDVATARHAISSGLVDMVGMTRAHMADPHIVDKVQTGREDRIRPCVGATYCLDHRVCLHNAATGREETLPHLVLGTGTRKKKVVVVGGGPAGLEAARVSALRGHDVVLFEAASRVGGQILLAAKATWRQDLIGIVDWLGSEVVRLGAGIRLNAYADRDAVLSEMPDVVIVATGGVPDMNQVDQGGRCVSVWDVLGGATHIAGDVLVFDGTGRHAALSCADFLASRRAKVELATSERTPGPEVGALEMPVFLKRFHEMGVALTPNVTLVRTEPADERIRVVLRHDYSAIEMARIVDWLVVEHGTLPADELYLELWADSLNQGLTSVDALADGLPQPFDAQGTSGFLLFRVGDAVASRNIHAAILDSLRICKDL